MPKREESEGERVFCSLPSFLPWSCPPLFKGSRYTHTFYYIHTYLPTDKHTCIYINAQDPLEMQSGLDTHTHTHTYTHTHTNTHTNTHTHTVIYIYVNMF